ncbi:MAG: hypothetical protein D6698_12765 [Gammaproteobacteria bacterium]|nr:MAG: hypothetical protein D6698_12765 [Gammaproteobacteria bacterium]
MGGGILLLLASGCGITLAPPPEPVVQGKTSTEEILETSEEEVRNCRLLGVVENSSILGKGFGLAGLDEAKETAIDRARTLGATHIVWLDVIQNGRVSQSDAGFNDTILVNGAAYFCEKGQLQSVTVEEEESENRFSFSEKELLKKDRFKVYESQNEKDATHLPETIPDKSSLEELPPADFGQDKIITPAPSRGITVDNGVDPFGQ